MSGEFSSEDGTLSTAVRVEEGEPGEAESGSFPRPDVEVEVQSGEGEDFDSLAEIPTSLPIQPLKNTVLFPHLLSPLLVNTPRSQKLIDEVLLRPDRLLVCTAVRREPTGSP